VSAAAAPAPGTAPAGPAGDGELSHRQILTILLGLMAGMFLAALDQTIVATSIRTIADDLQGLSVQAWATTAYLITATVTTPLYGKLSDLYGRKPFFLGAISIFVIGSLLSGFATSMVELAMFRAVQGVGAGGLFSLALAIVGDIVPPRQRAKYQGYFLAVFGTSSVLGPVVGGFLAGQATILGITGWRWVFLVNVPVGLVALAVVQRVLHLPHTRREHRVDWPGAVALVVALVPLLVLAEQGRAWGWTSPLALGLAVVGVAGLAAFLAAERAYGDDALLPLRFFRIRTFGIGTTLNFLIGVGMFGGLAALPLYLQIVKGATPTESGLLLLPLTAGIMAGSIVSGQAISRTGRYRVFPVVGSVLLVAGTLLFSRIGVDTPLWQTMAVMVVFGLGLGFNMQPLVLAIQNSVSPRDIGVATSSATFFRQMGGTLGTAVFLSVLFSAAGDRIAARLSTAAADPAFRAAVRDPAVAANPDNAPVLTVLGSGGGLPEGALDDSSFLSSLDPRLARPFLEGFADAMQVVFLIGAAVLALSLVVVAFLPQDELRGGSALSERLAADRADAGRTAQGVTGGAAAGTVAAPAPGTAPRTAPGAAAPASAASGTAPVPNP
jgi:EmrB/QacA subfamily drug resistance transporter